MVGCAAKPVVMQVEIVKPIPKGENDIGWACMIAPRPKPPEPIIINYEDEDALRRVWVHVRAYNEMVQYLHDEDFWAESMNNCMLALVKALR
jgi:hypothetical protein